MNNQSFFPLLVAAALVFGGCDGDDGGNDSGSMSGNTANSGNNGSSDSDSGNNGSGTNGSDTGDSGDDEPVEAWVCGCFYDCDGFEDVWDGDLLCLTDDEASAVVELAAEACGADLQDSCEALTCDCECEIDDDLACE